MAQLLSLLDCLFGAADQVFGLALDPEVRRIVGEVGQHGDERRSRQRRVYAFYERAIEVRDDGEHQVCGMLLPILV